MLLVSIAGGSAETDYFCNTYSSLNHSLTGGFPVCWGRGTMFHMEVAAILLYVCRR